MIGGSLIGVDAGTRLLGYLSHRTPLMLPTGHQAPVVNVVLDALFILMLSFTAVFIFREAWQARGTPPRGDKTIAGPLVTRVRILPYIDLPNV